ncbi:MAG: hypothetical protein ABI670_06975 [Chloroflexota bacterium]
MQDTSQPVLVKCLTPGCPNRSYGPICPSCLAGSQASEVTRQTTGVDQATCPHTHSVTGDFPMVKRLLPDYRGGQPETGYMLDICKTCLKALPERPYNPIRAMGRHSARVH